ncbi:MAG TPA: AAA family ATPase [Ferruginibacter sp.]|nr:AAA family ATPase [Ferruginibacter sp.]
MKKIVVIGPESTGKSFLCEQLASHYNSVWVKEYAREYLLTNGKKYHFDTLLDIAKGQIASEEAALRNFKTQTSNVKPVFIDTDMYVMKIWCEFVFYKTHRWILDRIAERKYDLYLLCGTDLPWVKDELREHPDPAAREILYKMYKDAMINQPVPWVEICGGYDERLQKAIAAVDSLTG